MDFGSWAAWANAVVAVVGLGGIFYQARKARQLNSSNLLLALESKFGEPGMILARREFAQLVKDHLTTAENAITGYLPVLSFYDMLAAQVNRGVLDEKLIWHRFGWRVIRCWLAIAINPTHHQNILPAPGSLIDRHRILESEPTSYEMLEWLGNRFVRKDIQVNRHGQELTREQLHNMVIQYYKQETALVVGYHQ